MEAYFLAGPTASGKTAMAHQLAAQHGLEILSADSMLIYRGMDIGTAKPTPEERGTVPYHGIDLASAAETFNSWQYRAYALKSLAEIEKRGRRAIVVGGTGLYLKALTHGFADAPGPDPTLRSHWEGILAEEGVAPLAAALKEQSPSLYEAIDDPDNGRRLVRFLEWAAAGLEAPPRNWNREVDSTPMAALKVDPDLLKSRIEQRVRAMYGQGLLDEVRGLLLSESGMSRTARQAIGYAEAIALLKGQCSQEEAIERTATRTRQLAKRQRTWLRTQAAVEWIDVTADTSVVDLAEAVWAQWDRQGPTGIVE
ncbi:MAG: tRNA (adenosine(37)-N6)-dimethylallyltransferase MiaA [Kiritimatiellia bacterium]|jgi:tRNA dimethylallyltransferase|nr:tRNA (adenosine(37)-N6)-dimethylallyltransferase MiaA [Kiritimatiellia bacterium]MDP6629505.1 tRNA (adenosine(37)-N6)-dimethylallyltransferase MiaA [Kiritimatiellia bacterium]MDP6809212.1 tRNA (adenosine(37)-N6)-dimethylallyltransferase MiaA [Kiritimatiellia bacterium]MDP7022951.1 tRNA (adenosine(37)-N6)-dimethylallyltransferase MiaA [Kiritimatiellia bacterium]